MSTAIERASSAEILGRLCSYGWTPGPSSQVKYGTLSSCTTSRLGNRSFPISPSLLMPVKKKWGLGQDFSALEFHGCSGYPPKVGSIFWYRRCILNPHAVAVKKSASNPHSLARSYKASKCSLSNTNSFSIWMENSFRLFKCFTNRV